MMAAAESLVIDTYDSISVLQTDDLFEGKPFFPSEKAYLAIGVCMNYHTLFLRKAYLCTFAG